MKAENETYFRCISCPSLTLKMVATESVKAETIQGSLVCPKCGASYPIKDEIPRFVISEDYSQSFGFQWTVHRKTQLDSYSGLPISRKRLFDVTQWPADMSGELILEAGSGAGRFTEVLVETGAQIFSFDYSAAVDSNWRNNRQSDNLQLFQADLCKIPLYKGSFDKVLCLGVLQHTPAPRASFQRLAEMVRPGGELVIDAYRKDFLALLQWKYVLRPITKWMPQQALYKAISWAVPLLLPLAKTMRKIAGRAGARIVPIVEYSYLGLPAELNAQWAILDTFDMYSPAYDFPQTREGIERWYREEGFVDVFVTSGPNGLIGKGRRP